MSLPAKRLLLLAFSLRNPLHSLLPLPSCLYQSANLSFFSPLPFAGLAQNRNPLFSMRESTKGRGPLLAVVFFIERRGDGWGGEKNLRRRESKDVRAEGGGCKPEEEWSVEEI